MCLLTARTSFSLCCLFWSVKSILAYWVPLWFSLGLHLLCVVKCSMPSSSLGEGRTLSMDFNRSSQLLTLFFVAFGLWRTPPLLPCITHLVPEDRQKCCAWTLLGSETIRAARSSHPSLTYSIVATSLNTAPQRGPGCLADILSSDVCPCPP